MFCAYTEVMAQYDTVTLNKTTPHFLCLKLTSPTDVPRRLTNDLWVFLFQTIDAECVK